MNKYIQTYNLCLQKLQFLISGEKFEHGPGGSRFDSRYKFEIFSWNLKQFLKKLFYSRGWRCWNPLAWFTIARLTSSLRVRLIWKLSHLLVYRSSGFLNMHMEFLSAPICISIVLTRNNCHYRKIRRSNEEWNLQGRNFIIIIIIIIIIMLHFVSSPWKIRGNVLA